MNAVRWVLAVIAGVVGYWIALLMSLGALALAIQNLGGNGGSDPAVAVGHSVLLLSLSLGIGTFVGCILSIVIAPRAHWRTVAYIAVAIGIAWAVYGQVYAGHAAATFAIEALSAAAGAALAFFAASTLFGRAAAAAK